MNICDIRCYFRGRRKKFKMEGPNYKVESVT